MSSVRWSRLLVAAPLVAGAVLLGACSGDDDDDDSGGGGDADVAAVVALVAAADVDAGSDVYGSRCLSCHGDDGGGGVGPSLEGVAERLTVDEQANTVVNGRGSQMPAWGGELSDAEIAEVIAFTRTL